MSVRLCPANQKLTDGVQVGGRGVVEEALVLSPVIFFVSLLGAFSSQKQCQYVMILSGIHFLVRFFWVWWEQAFNFSTLKSETGGFL